MGVVLNSETPLSGIPLFDTNSIVDLKLSGSLLVGKGSTSRDSYGPAVFYTRCWRIAWASGILLVLS